MSRWNRPSAQAPASGLFASLLILALVPGCAWRQAERHASFDALYSNASYQPAAELAGRYGGGAPESGNLLWSLQRATALQAKGDHEEAIRIFDTTEAFFRVYDEEGALSRWLGQTGAVLTNDASLPYRGTLYDAIMVNSYKALGFMALGQPENARVELNRARDRQRRAVDAYAEQIRAEQRALTKKDRANQEVDLDATLARAHREMAGEYTQLSRWAVYPDYVNPLATWLEGLFLMTHNQAPGDFEKATDALERVAGMVPENQWVRKDYEWANDLASGRKRYHRLPPTVWVLYEKGQGPLKVERRVQLPVLFSHSGTSAIYTGFAYPMLRYRTGVNSSLSVRANGQETARTDVVSDMQAVISTEFSRRLPRIVTRAVAASLARTMIQYQLRRHWGELAGFIGLLYQLGSTQADTRIWSSLPREFSVARVERNAGERVTLEVNGRQYQPALPDNRLVLIWVRQPTSAADPAIEVIPLSDQK